MDPVVTLTTDFGTRDPYVAAMKGVLLAGCPGVRVVDLSHEIAPQDVLEGALFLAAAVPAFPAGTIHVAVVDPGVGGDRRPIVARVAAQVVVCPDNGLLSLLARSHAVESARVIASPDFMRVEVSATFHGRDVFAPTAARLAAGSPFDAVGPAVDPRDLVRIELPAPDVAAGGAVRGAVIHVDRFGNAITNLARADLPPGTVACVAGGRRVPLRRTYADATDGEALALIGSGGLLEIAVSGGSAAERLGLRRGDAVIVEPSATGV